MLVFGCVNGWMDVCLVISKHFSVVKIWGSHHPIEKNDSINGWPSGFRNVCFFAVKTEDLGLRSCCTRWSFFFLWWGGYPAG